MYMMSPKLPAPLRGHSIIEFLGDVMRFGGEKSKQSPKLPALLHGHSIINFMYINSAILLFKFKYVIFVISPFESRQSFPHPRMGTPLCTLLIQTQQ